MLVLGVTGMLGHKMWQILSNQFADVYGTMRSKGNDPQWDEFPSLRSDRIVDSMNASEIEPFLGRVRELKPDIIVNCIGTIKQRAAAENHILSLTLNSLLPHRLAADCNAWGGRLIHFSTDCVFSGKRGDYTEQDPSDADDLYGKSKYLGEAIGGNSVVLRTSIIGRELQYHASLLDWFLLGGHKSVRGFSQAWWSGVTTNHLCQLVASIIVDHRDLCGLYQVSSGKISKNDLLNLIKKIYELNVEVTPDHSFYCDRSLVGEHFAQATGYRSPGLPAMIQELKDDPSPYRAVRT